jgi:hypothetical protein
MINRGVSGFLKLCRLDATPFTTESAVSLGERAYSLSCPFPTSPPLILPLSCTSPPIFSAPTITTTNKQLTTPTSQPCPTSTPPNQPPQQPLSPHPPPQPRPPTPASSVSTATSPRRPAASPPISNPNASTSTRATTPSARQDEATVLILVPWGCCILRRR